MACQCNQYRGEEDETCPNCGRTAIEILEDELSNQEFVENWMELNTIEERNPNQLIEANEANVVEDNMQLIAAESSDEADDSDSSRDESNDGDDHDSKILKLLEKNKKDFENFLQAKRSLSDVYLKLDQMEIMLATIFGTRFGTFTDAVGEVLTAMLDYEVQREDTMQRITEILQPTNNDDDDSSSSSSMESVY